MTPHLCTGEDYPNGGITCLCDRGQDHPEDLYNVPVGQEGDDA